MENQNTNRQKIYQKIRDIAHSLNEKGATYTRADLAYDLRELDIKNDSSQINKLVWEAYTYYKNDKHIQQAFIDNAGKESLISSYQITEMIEEGNNNALFPLLQKKLNGCGNSLDKLNQALQRIGNDPTSSTNANFLNTVVGTQGVSKVQNDARLLFENYSKLIAVYDDSKYQVKSIITDFVNLRTQICDTYRYYSALLVNVFGDGIKAINPELFDFDSIEWLDIQGMLQRIKLDYDKITEKCKTLMSDIADSFQQSLKSASNAYRQTGSRQAGLLLAGLNMVSHYMDAKTMTTELQQDLLTLKNSVKHDVVTIKGDLGRLLVIYKTMNDLYIPQAEAFLRFCNQVFSTEWKQIEDALYQEQAMQTLKQELDVILDEYKLLEKEMTDEQLNIDFYSSRIEENTQLLNSMRPQYEQAKCSKPVKPFFIADIFTFGSASKNYNRDIYEWHAACAPVISRYEDLQTDVKIDKDELQNMQDCLKNNQHRYKELKKALELKNKALREQLKNNENIQKTLLPHLEDLIKLLRGARKIANLKLDVKLMKTVKFETTSIELPEETKQNIRGFTDALRGSLSIDADTAQQNLDFLSDCPSQKLPDTPQLQQTTGNKQPEHANNKVDAAAIAEAGNSAIQSAINLLESWNQLKSMQAQSTIANQTYDQELKKLQDQFRQNIADIDNKNAILREILKRMNTAQNHEQLKEGLLSLLGEDKNTFSEKDWNEFLNGNKTIEL